MTGESSWWVVTMRAGGRWFLPTGDGEHLRQMLSTRANKCDAAPMFAEVEDVSGSPVLLQIDDIIECWLTTPAVRDREDDPNGLIEEIRSRSQVISQRKWDETL